MLGLPLQPSGSQEKWIGGEGWGLTQKDLLTPNAGRSKHQSILGLEFSPKKFVFFFECFYSQNTMLEVRGSPWKSVEVRGSPWKLDCFFLPMQQKEILPVRIFLGTFCIRKKICEVLGF